MYLPITRNPTMISKFWFQYLCFQAILFTALLESWMNAEANRGGMLAKPIHAVDEEDTAIRGVHSFTVHYFEDEELYIYDKFDLI